MRDPAHTLSDFRVPTLSIECEPCGRRGRYNVAKLVEKYGDAKLPELRHVLAHSPKARSHSIHDRCKIRYVETACSHEREMACKEVRRTALMRQVFNGVADRYHSKDEASDAEEERDDCERVCGGSEITI